VIITTTRSDEDSVVFDFDLDQGITAFADSEWMSDGGPVPALLVYAQGKVAWWDGAHIQTERPVPMATAKSDPEAVATGVVAALARAAVAALPVGSRSDVAVTGSGIVASSIRALLHGPSVLRDETDSEGNFPVSPLSVVDTTGSPSVIMSVANRLVGLGTLVLAGARISDPSPINMYSDVHKRGLRLVGIPYLPEDEYFPGANHDRAEVAVLGQPIKTAKWYRLSST
jgi:hypothetical protein